MDIDYSSLSDQDLSEMLKDYGVSVGPINMATRKTYERKLQKLKTGKDTAPSQKYEPVADDEDEQEVQFKQTHTPVAPKVKASPARVQVQQPPPTRVQPSPARVPLPATPSMNTPEPPTIPRYQSSQRDTFDVNSPVESRPDLPRLRKSTLSYDPKLDRSLNTSVNKEESKREEKSLPMWIKLVVVFIIAALIYLIYTNMESNTLSSVPKLPGKVEV